MDATTLSHINLFAVLGALQDLCRLDVEARSQITETDTSITFVTRRGPTGTLTLDRGSCRMEQGARHGQIRLYLHSPDRLNALMRGQVTPIPLRGFRHLRILTGPFERLTKRMEAVMSPPPEELQDRVFRALHTEMLLHVAGAALVEVGNHDPELQDWAAAMPDGTIALTVVDGPALSVTRQNGRLSFARGMPTAPRARMQFRDMDAAFDVLTGRSDSFSAIAAERLSLSGFIPMLDALDKLLIRAGAYLT